MPPVNTVAACPNCRQPITVAIEQVFDAGADPNAKQRFMRGRFNAFTCPNCSFRSMLSAPLVYHDPEKELLLTFVPMELGLPSPEAERVLGRLTQQVINALPAEKRKGYLLRPQAMLTLQGMLDRVLEADGITREMLDAQRAKVALAQKFIAADPQTLPDLVKQHDAELDYAFFDLLALSAQNAAAQGDGAGAERMMTVRDAILQLSSVGQELKAQADKQAQSLEEAARLLEGAGRELTRERFLEFVSRAKDEDQVAALVALARPAADYEFFRLLSEKIDAASGPEHDRLFQLRESVLRATQEVDRVAQAQVQEASEVIRALLSAPNPDEALGQLLPAIDETVLTVLSANVEGARRQGRNDIADRLQALGDRIMAALQAAAPPEIQFINQLLAVESDEEVEAMLRNRAPEVTEALVEAMAAVADTLRRTGRTAEATRVEEIRGLAQKQAL